MSETIAAPSAESTDVFNGEQPSLAEYAQYRQTGELPERFKPAETVADPAPAEEIEVPEAEEAESVDESETSEEQQEKPGKKGAEFRIKQLLAEKKRLEAALASKQTPAESSPAKPAAPQNYQDYRKTFKPSEWVAEYGKQNPDASYEDATAAMADHLADVRDQFRTIEQQRQSQAKELNDKVTDARARYGEKFDEVLAPTLNAIVGDAQVNPTVKAMINDSDVVADLIFTLGSDPETLDKFLSLAKTQPGKALRYIAAVESGIIEELAKPAEETPRGDDGKFKSAAPPAKPKTSAPKPPSPVSGASTGAFDVSDESLSPDEWMRKRNSDLSRRNG